MNSRSDDARRRDSSSSLMARTASLDILFSRGLSPGIQRERKPRRRPLVPTPRHLRPYNLVATTGDRPFLRRERVESLLGGGGLFLSRQPRIDGSVP